MRDRGYLDQVKQTFKDAHEKSKNTDDTNTTKEEEDLDSNWSSVDAEDILRQRFAGGEIDEDEYEQRLKILRK